MIDGKEQPAACLHEPSTSSQLCETLQGQCVLSLTRLLEPLAIACSI